MAITAEMVKDLREQTGAGMMDCKKALTETDGDFEAAVKLLREKGIAVAAKRESRVASEGLVGLHMSADQNVGVMVELNCETTFVAKTDEFAALANNIANHIGHLAADAMCQDVAALMCQPYYENGALTIQEMINHTVAKLGEKTSVARFIRYDVGGPDHERSGVIGSYIHMGGQIGVMVELNTDSEGVAQSDGILQLAKDLAMHISWSNPEYLCRDDVPENVVEAEREIHRQWAIKEGKPEKILDRIIDGKMKEFYSRVCLLEQPNIKDQDQTIGEMIKLASKDAGEEVCVARFVRFRVGESVSA